MEPSVLLVIEPATLTEAGYVCYEFPSALQPLEPYLLACSDSKLYRARRSRDGLTIEEVRWRAALPACPPADQRASLRRR